MDNVLTMPEIDENAERRAQRGDFMRALDWLLNERDISQRQLANDLGWSHTKLTPWRKLVGEPRSWEVFALEEYLRVPPGTLARHLGYLPPDARAIDVDTVKKAIEADPALPDWGRDLLLHTYQKVLESLRRRR